jgi:hypothetical protein
MFDWIAAHDVKLKAAIQNVIQQRSTLFSAESNGPGELFAYGVASGGGRDAFNRVNRIPAIPGIDPILDPL